MLVKGMNQSCSPQDWIPAFAGMTRFLSLIVFYHNRIARHPGESRDPSSLATRATLKLKTAIETVANGLHPWGERDATQESRSTGPLLRKIVGRLLSGAIQ